MFLSKNILCRAIPNFAISSFRPKQTSVGINNETLSEHPFDVIQHKRRNEALNSVLFVNTSNPDALLNYCLNCGQIANAFFFNRTLKSYALIEFVSSSNIKRLLDITKHFPNAKRIPMDSHFLYFTGSSSRVKNHNLLRVKQNVVDNFGSIDFSNEDLMRCDSVDSQINLLHKKLSFSELDIRLRYFIAAEIERLSKRLFDQSYAHLYGSSVTGLGKYNSDVDINIEIEPNFSQMSASKESMKANASYFMSKLKHENDRTFSQQVLSSYSSLIKNFVPQLANVHAILRARVPIVKFKHSPTDIECDLCHGDRETKNENSRLLYHLFHSQPFILPFMFTIRQWARCSEVTRSYADPSLSNFMLSLLAVFYLQNHPSAVLPSIKRLLQDPKVSSPVSKISTESLLLGFFKFYSELDFSKNGISIYEGTFIPKPKIEVPATEENPSASSTTVEDPLHLENPVERSHNAGKNVNIAKLSHFQASCSEAYELLSSSLEPNGEAPWGLLKILTTEEVKTDNETGENELSLNESTGEL